MIRAMYRSLSLNGLRSTRSPSLTRPIAFSWKTRGTYSDVARSRLGGSGRFAAEGARNGIPFQIDSAHSVWERKNRDPSRSMLMTPLTEAIIISSGSGGGASQMMTLSAPACDVAKRRFSPEKENGWGNFPFPPENFQDLGAGTLDRRGDGAVGGQV